MWLWWVLSLVILVACIIFAYRMIVSSYEFLPIDKRYFLRFDKNVNESLKAEPVNRDGYKALKNKLHSFEDNNTFYQIQFKKFQERLQAIEDALVANSSSSKGLHAIKDEDWKEMYYAENEAKEKLENELDLLQQKLNDIQSNFKEADIEDWKEMYYAENEAKIKIENELDFTKEKLDETRRSLQETSAGLHEMVELKSNYDARMNDIHSLENNINLLQRELAASIERENELENLLISEIIIREKYSMLKSKYTQLQIETNDLQKRIVEQSQKEMNLEIRLIHLSELESKLAISESEKIKLKSRLENQLLG